MSFFSKKQTTFRIKSDYLIIFIKFFWLDLDECYDFLLRTSILCFKQKHTIELVLYCNHLQLQFMPTARNPAVWLSACSNRKIYFICLEQLRTIFQSDLICAYCKIRQERTMQSVLTFNKATRTIEYTFTHTILVTLHAMEVSRSLTPIWSAPRQ